jgi:aa3 type cytochrome c oxidase subunit IV
MTDAKTDGNWRPEMDEAEHEGTYEGFVAFTKYGIIAMTALLILMAVFLL